jgi:phage terminase large subunit GpA-like protein
MIQDQNPILDLAHKVTERLAPPPKITVSQWADAERRLSPEASAEPGRWSTDRAPHQRGPMDAVKEPGVQRIVLMWSAQVGKTEIILNILGYFMAHDPSPMLLTQPSLEMAEAFSKDRLAPMIRDTPALRARVKDVRSRDSGNTILHKKFPGGQLTMAGANSPASLASRPVRIVLNDEVDRYPRSAGTEGDPVALSQKRATTFYNRFFIEVSTPTIEGASRIAESFEESDKRFREVPCPECGGYQVLKFSNFKWDIDEAGRPVRVRYSCIHCPAEFDDSKKDEMLRAARWVATAPFKGTAGFHIWEAYSPWRRWSEIIADHLDALKSPDKLKTWTNTALAETWKEKTDAPKWKLLYDRRELYQIGIIPRDCVFLTAGADVQRDRIEVEIVGWTRGKRSYSIDYRVFHGDTALDRTQPGSPWAEVDKLLMEEWPHESGVSLPIRALAVDSGFNTQQVYAWARCHSVTRVIAVKGSERASTILTNATKVDLKIDGRRVRRGFQIWNVGVDQAKSEFYAWLRLEKPMEGEPYPAGYCHFPEYGQEYFEQLTAEELVRRIDRKGYSFYQWEKKRERNEALDCRVYARAAAAFVGMDRFTDSHWETLEKEMGSVKPAVAKTSGKQDAEKKEKKRRNRDGSFW